MIAAFIVCHAAIVLMGFQIRSGELGKRNKCRWSFDWHFTISKSYEVEIEWTVTHDFLNIYFFEIDCSRLKHDDWQASQLVGSLGKAYRASFVFRCNAVLMPLYCCSYAPDLFH